MNENMNYEEMLSNKKIKAQKSKSVQKECADMLITMINETNDYEALVRYFMELHYSVFDIFLDKFDLTEDNKAEKIVNAFIKNEDFKKNTNSSGIKRGLILCNSLIKNNIDQAIISRFFFEVICLGEKKSGFSDTFIDEFKKYIVDKNQFELYKMLTEITENESYKLTMQRLLSAIEADINKDIESAFESEDNTEDIGHVAEEDANEAFVENSETEKNAIEETELDEEERKGVLLVAEKTDDNLKILAELQKLKELIVSQGANLANIVSIVDRCSKYETEIAAYKEELARKDISIEELDNLLKVSKSKIFELENKLKESYSINKMRENQEFEAFKINVANTLMMEYKECTSEDAAIFNEDNFEANYASLQRIFRILKRYGFQFE